MSEPDDPAELWDGDLNEAVIDEWIDETTTFDRVRQVIDVTTEPQPVSRLADRARVSEPTARKYLSALAETGRIKRINAESGVQYMRAPQMLAMRRIAAIHTEHTKDEIRDAIADLKQQRATFKDRHGVETIDELVLTIDAGDEGWTDIARWRQVEQNLKIAQAALTLYHFDPDDSFTAAARAAETSTQTHERGAFGNDVANSTA